MHLNASNTFEHCSELPSGASPSRSVLPLRFDELGVRLKFWGLGDQLAKWPSRNTNDAKSLTCRQQNPWKATGHGSHLCQPDGSRKRRPSKSKKKQTVPAGLSWHSRLPQSRGSLESIFTPSPFSPRNSTIPSTAKYSLVQPYLFNELQQWIQTIFQFLKTVSNPAVRWQGGKCTLIYIYI